MSSNGCSQCDCKRKLSSEPKNKDQWLEWAPATNLVKDCPEMSQMCPDCDANILEKLNKFSYCESQKMMQDFYQQEYIFGSTPRGGNLTDTCNSGEEQESDNNISSCSTLDVDKAKMPMGIHMENLVMELQIQLKNIEEDRNNYKKQLDDAIEERERAFNRLEIVSSAHESRITEMHCVIAELSKKLRTKQDSTIFEENEPEESVDLSFNDGSIYNSEANYTNPEADCHTESQEAEIQTNINIIPQSQDKAQVETLQEEVFRLKGQVALLQSQIASKNISNTEEFLDQNNSSLINNKFNSANNENPGVKNDITIPIDLNSGESISDNEECNTKDFLKTSIAKDLKINSFSETPKFLEKQPIYSRHQFKGLPISKKAERVKLRRTIEKDDVTDVTNINNSEIKNTKFVERLAPDNIQLDSFADETIDQSYLQRTIQRLERSIENLKIKNSILDLTFNECKRDSEHIYLLCGKYESNAIALQLALNYSDRTIEAYDVLLALLESKLAMLEEKSSSAQESRKSVEAVARHLLDRLESEKNINENSLGPWQNTVCISNSQLNEPWTQDEDNRLRSHVSKLKAKRATMQNTTVVLESPFFTDYKDINMKEISQENINNDLEMAILTQELISLREDIISYKQKVEIADREKNLAIEKVSVLQDALSQLQSQLTDSEALLSFKSRDRTSYSDVEQTALLERQLVEALTRESQLKKRIQSLIGSLSASRKSSDEKNAQIEYNLVALQKNNISLTQSLEQCKKKYQAKIRHLEQKILDMNIEINRNCRRLERPASVPETTL